MIAVIVIVVLSLASIGGGVWIALRTRGKLPIFVCALLAMVPFSVSAALFEMTWKFCYSPQHDWNGAKLAPILAMVKGDPETYRLYQPPDTGVMTAWIYGPVPALLFLPAAIASRPTGAVLIALLINVVIFFGIVAWLHIRLARRPMLPIDGAKPAGSAFAWLLMGVFAWLCVTHESLGRASLMIGPDSPTIAFSIASILVLLGKRGPMQMTLSALCAVLACWCKQSALPFLAVAPLYILVADGAVAAVSYALILTVVGTLVSTVFILSFGPSNMLFHMVSLSRNHGWEHEKENSHLVLLLRAVMSLILECMVSIGLVVLALLIERFIPRPPTPALHSDRREAARQWARDNPWVMLPIAAIFYVPSSLLGFLKVGGYVNNFALTHTFIALTASALLIRVYSTIRTTAGDLPGDTEPSSPERLPARTAQSLVLGALGIFFLWHWPAEILPKRMVATMLPAIREPSTNQQEVIYDYLKRNPGTVYFPWNPLAALMAEGKLYHFEWGAHDRLAAGMVPSLQQIIAHLPKGVRYVGFGPLHQNEDAMERWFPDAKDLVEIRELPGFRIYTQLPRQQPPPTTPRTPGEDVLPGLR